MADILEIRRMLEARVQSVCEHLLPGGKRDGQEWRAGSVAGEPGQSLGVHLAGAKAGTWCDFANPDEDKGDLIDLWGKVRNLPLAQALEEARSWLGIDRPKLHRPRPVEYTRPAKPQCRAPAEHVKDYLIEERNLPGWVVELYRIGEAGRDIVFPFLLPDGTLAMVKTRRAEAGARPKPTAAGYEPVLFGWQAIPDDAREISIVEGEIDAPSLRAYGYHALSVPFGGGAGEKQKWIESEFERMERFERIFLVLDDDEQGNKAAEEIASRLGRHRCLRVRLPRKDANQCLMDGVEQAEIDAAMASAAHLDPEGLRRPSDFAEAVVELFHPSGGVEPGYSTPYAKLQRKLLFRPGEVTLWAGETGSGKSQILGDCIPKWIEEGARICLSSLEMKPAQLMRRQAKQVTGIDRPSVEYIRAALAWLDQGLLIYELLGKTKIADLLNVFGFARAKYGCDVFVIDSLMRLGLAVDDYAGQEELLSGLVDWALANAVHVHLVAHERKRAERRGPGDTNDVKGASEIANNAANILSIWRNRDLENRIRRAESDDDKAKLAEKPGVILNVAKQRNGDFEGQVGLWFDRTTYQYQSAHDRSIWGRRYLPDDWHSPATTLPGIEM